MKHAVLSQPNGSSQFVLLSVIYLPIYVLDIKRDTFSCCQLHNLLVLQFHLQGQTKPNKQILAMLNDDGTQQHIQYSEILMGLISALISRH